jgi:hypothetical protein
MPVFAWWETCSWDFSWFCGSDIDTCDFLYYLPILCFFLIFPDFLRHRFSIMFIEVVQNSWKDKRFFTLEKVCQTTVGQLPRTWTPSPWWRGEWTIQKISSSGLQSLGLFPNTAKVALKVFSSCTIILVQICAVFHVHGWLECTENKFALCQSSFW